MKGSWKKIRTKSEWDFLHHYYHLYSIANFHHHFIIIVAVDKIITCLSQSVRLVVDKVGKIIFISIGNNINLPILNHYKSESESEIDTLPLKIGGWLFYVLALLKSLVVDEVDDSERSSVTPRWVPLRVTSVHFNVIIIVVIVTIIITVIVIIIITVSHTSVCSLWYHSVTTIVTFTFTFIMNVKPWSFWDSVFTFHLDKLVEVYWVGWD